MLKKIISIKNVGRFRNSATSPNPQLGKHTFIALGETLEECSAILERSFASISDE